jgi:hypothetical protein
MMRGGWTDYCKDLIMYRNNESPLTHSIPHSSFQKLEVWSNTGFLREHIVVILLHAAQGSAVRGGDGPLAFNALRHLLGDGSHCLRHLVTRPVWVKRQNDTKKVVVRDIL